MRLFCSSTVKLVAPLSLSFVYCARMAPELGSACTIRLLTASRK